MNFLQPCRVSVSFIFWPGFGSFVWFHCTALRSALLLFCKCFINKAGQYGKYLHLHTIILPRGCTYIFFRGKEMLEHTQLKVSETIFHCWELILAGGDSENGAATTRRRRRLPKRLNRDLILSQHLCQTSCGWQLCSCACWFTNTLIQKQLS